MSRRGADAPERTGGRVTQVAAGGGDGWCVRQWLRGRVSPGFVVSAGEGDDQGDCSDRDDRAERAERDEADFEPSAGSVAVSWGVVQGGH
jgi:hypothetical protein